MLLHSLLYCGHVATVRDLHTKAESVGEVQHSEAGSTTEQCQCQWALVRLPALTEMQTFPSAVVERWYLFWFICIHAFRTIQSQTLSTPLPASHWLDHKLKPNNLKPEMLVFALRGIHGQWVLRLALDKLMLHSSVSLKRGAVGCGAALLPKPDDQMYPDIPHCKYAVSSNIKIMLNLNGFFPNIWIWQKKCPLKEFRREREK